MHLITLIALLVTVALCIAALLLKFIRNAIANCIAIRNIKWGALRVKILDYKIAVEINALTIQLVLLSDDPVRSTFTSRSCFHSKTISRTKNESPSAVFSSLSSRIMTNSSRIISAIFRPLASYLFSCFTIVLKDCLLELETINGECVQVIRFLSVVSHCH